MSLYPFVFAEGGQKMYACKAFVQLIKPFACGNILVVVKMHIYIFLKSIPLSDMHRAYLDIFYSCVYYFTTPIIV